MRIRIDRSTGMSLSGELHCRCPNAGGIRCDETYWLPDDPGVRSEARRRLLRILLVRAVLNIFR